MDDAEGHHEPQLAVVREMWATYREQGVEAALPLLHPAVEFVDHRARCFRGHDGVRRFFAAFDEQGLRFTAFPYGFEARGGELLVSGYRRVDGEEPGTGEPTWFALRARDGLIVRASAHDSRAEAEEGIAARAAAAEADDARPGDDTPG